MIGAYAASSQSPLSSHHPVNQHAGPNDATYSTGSPTSRTTIHGQRGFLRSSVMPAYYRQRAECGKTNLRCDFRSGDDHPPPTVVAASSTARLPSAEDMCRGIRRTYFRQLPETTNVAESQAVSANS